MSTDCPPVDVCYLLECWAVVVPQCLVYSCTGMTEVEAQSPPHNHYTLLPRHCMRQTLHY
uniref:Secreted protein n=1 Tax=Mesocestoides corti TaxID=53468 RepID=A0A5K3G391_MESCO